MKQKTERLVPDKLPNQTPVYAVKMITQSSAEKFPEHAASQDRALNLDAGAGIIMAVRVADENTKPNLYVIMGRNFRGNWNCCLGGKVEGGETYKNTAIREAQEEFFFSFAKQFPLIKEQLSSYTDVQPVMEQLEAHLNSPQFKLLNTNPMSITPSSVVYRNISWVPAKNKDGTDIHHKFSRASFFCIDPIVYTPDQLSQVLSSMNFIATTCVKLRNMLIQTLGVERNHPAVKALADFTEFNRFQAFSAAELISSITAWSKPTLVETLQADAQVEVIENQIPQIQTFQRFEPMVLREVFCMMGMMQREQYDINFDIAPDIAKLPENSMFTDLQSTVCLSQVPGILFAVPKPVSSSPSLPLNVLK